MEEYEGLQKRAVQETRKLRETGLGPVVVQHE